MTVIIEVHTSTKVKTAESDKTFPTGKVHFYNVFLKEALKKTAS